MLAGATVTSVVNALLIMASVILLVYEFQLIFDGVGEAITPIISVSLSENCFPGARKVWRLAVRTAAAASIRLPRRL